ncbi:hypothetical protein IMZ31_22485 (plasmid) [Pontibacillus sp. ALD_SL1]|uniref:hypothetical protein n=1 Tax=Pontibacillus sp. ALD_SL1 TaxID=2777185 RepID=UPI001A96E97A|nr:hypothetical protein [Pontibacillus sp. ALD_SL1]QST02224.1 hypothetical protein IMZ31_22485 [Pontibacillus sp. ALD_SL1]
MKYVWMILLGVGLLPYPFYHIVQWNWFQSTVPSYYEFWFYSFVCILLFFFLAGMGLKLSESAFILYATLVGYLSFWFADLLFTSVDLTWKGEGIFPVFVMFLSLLLLLRKRSEKG